MSTASCRTKKKSVLGLGILRYCGLATSTAVDGVVNITEGFKYNRECAQALVWMFACVCVVCAELHTTQQTQALECVHKHASHANTLAQFECVFVATALALGLCGAVAKLGVAAHLIVGGIVNNGFIYAAE